MKFSDFEIILVSKEHCKLPRFKGSTLRGAFGHSFRRLHCSENCSDCSACSLKERCVYAYIFETPPPSGVKMLKKYPHAPHPFIIEPPLEEKREYHPGEELSYRLILLGKAIKYVPHFIYAFEEMSKRGLGYKRSSFHLARVYSTNSLGSRLVYSYQDRIVREEKIFYNELVFPIPSSLPERLKILFITPTRLIYNSRLSRVPEFHILVRSLLRRLSLLSYYHSRGEFTELDFKSLIDSSLRVKFLSSKVKWQSWERYSNRQKRKINMGGFIGEAVYSKGWQNFYQLLKIGEIIHIGKGAVFGLGKYQLFLDF